MVAHEKRNSAQLFLAVSTQNYLALSFLFFHRPTHTKVGIAYDADIPSFVWDFYFRGPFRLSDSFQLFCGISVFYFFFLYNSCTLTDCVPVVFPKFTTLNLEVFISLCIIPIVPEHEIYSSIMRSHILQHWL